MGATGDGGGGAMRTPDALASDAACVSAASINTALSFPVELPPEVAAVLRVLASLPLRMPETCGRTFARCMFSRSKLKKQLKQHAFQTS